MFVCYVLVGQPLASMKMLLFSGGIHYSVQIAIDFLAKKGTLSH